MQFSPDEMRAQVERGEAMDKVLNDPAFHLVVDTLTQYHLAALVACRPAHKEDADALAYHHAAQFALTEIVDQLKQFSAAGKAASEALQWSAENPED